MLTRRHFNKVLGSLVSLPLFASCKEEPNSNSKATSLAKPQNIVISTWNNQKANKTAIDILKANPSEILTAIEKGINTVEEDPNDQSVGYGGRPDRDGHVTLDACIMNKEGHAGAVTFMENYVNAISVARKVLEDTPHVILSGSGAEKFAKEKGFPKTNLLTEASRKDLEEWLIKSEYSPKVNIERHDTIGMIAQNINGDMSGGCSTSGLSYKIAGRVGDSPIIGAGLFVDNNYGCATATGLGELVLENCSTFLVVELMRQGLSPQKACEEAVNRIIEKQDTKDMQVGFIAISKSGEYGAYSLQKGFNFVVSTDLETQLVEAKSYYS